MTKEILAECLKDVRAMLVTYSPGYGGGVRHEPKDAEVATLAAALYAERMRGAVDVWTEPMLGEDAKASIVNFPFPDHD